jgi:NhaP-type Na+/H+ or K+/H+ antiporter
METLFLISCTILACLTPVWYASGRVAQGLLGVPSITGILAAGLLAGPHALGLLRPHHLALLHSSRVEGVCLSYISLLAGTELKAGDVQRTRRLVFTLVLSISLASWAAVALGFWTLKNYLPLFSGLSWYEIVAVSNMLGVLAIARSPAAAVSRQKIRFDDRARAFIVPFPFFLLPTHSYRFCHRYPY